MHLAQAKNRGIKTWVSFEPVIDPEAVLMCICQDFDLFDKIKVGKLNYHKSSVDWKAFGLNVEHLLQQTGVEYYIKESLRKEMEK